MTNINNKFCKHDIAFVRVLNTASVSIKRQIKVVDAKVFHFWVFTNINSLVEYFPSHFWVVKDFTKHHLVVFRISSWTCQSDDRCVS